MSKLTLQDIATGFNLPLIVNSNNDLVELALENTLSRDGTTPNGMLASFDMNSHTIINLGSPQAASDAVRLIDIQAGVVFTGIPVPAQTGNAEKFLVTDGTVATWRYPTWIKKPAGTFPSIGIGEGALAIEVGGATNENTAYGTNTLHVMVSGLANLAVGHAAMIAANATSFNTSVGVNSMLFYTTGAGQNTVIGYGAYARALTGSNNFAGGFESMHDNRDGVNCVAIGSESLTAGLNGAIPAPSDPSFCVAIGTESARYASNVSNTAIGCNAMTGVAVTFSTGSQNVAVGYKALFAFTTAAASVVIGSEAGSAITTAASTTIVGFQSGKSLTTGSSNTYIGGLTGFYNATASNNVYIGLQAGLGLVGNAGGGNNVVIGMQACDSATAVSNNVIVGYQAMRVTTASGTVAIGYQAGLVATSATSCVLIGDRAGNILTTGSDNIFIGALSGVGVTTGIRNVSIGSGATGSGNYTNTVAVGFDCEPNASNTITLGDTNMTQIRAQVTVITALSDARDKKEAINLPIGLDFINTLRPVKFVWNQRDGNRVGLVDYGFLAQELAVAETGNEWLGLVSHTNPDRLEASPGKLIPVLVKAIQELTTRLAQLEDRS